MNGSKLIIVSNRLPVKIQEIDGSVSVEQSSGGLITAITGFIEYQKKEEETLWIGYPDCEESLWKKGVGQMDNSRYKYVPVYLPDEQYNGYYNGFSNSTIWPLFHYFPSFAEYVPGDFDQYKSVNQAFCDILCSLVKPGDTIWLHDYHLMLLPAMLRKKLGSDVAIGFFLHIPFPSFEIFRLLPADWRESLLKGILGADLVGFHTKDYAAYFSHSVQKILGISLENNLFKNENHISRVDYYPISIDFNKFNSAFSEKHVTDLREQMRENLGNKQVIFSVDRLDYTKGISNRLVAYRLFLTENPDYLERVVFVLNVVPSRDEIFKYSERKKMIDEYVGNLNSDFGNINWQPVVYQYRNLDFDNLLAFYTLCDLALITPVRDGMNLVAKEFVASRNDEKGVLILSEMAGSAIELSDALLINPTDIRHSASQIKAGLEMPLVEQKERMIAMRSKVCDYDVVQWASDFMNDLQATKEKQRSFATRYLRQESMKQLQKEHRTSQKRLFLLDYDGTLVPYYKNPLDSAPSTELLEILTKLSLDPQNEMYIISGRKSVQLDNWIGHLNLNIVAEHGAKVRLKDTDLWNAQPVLNEEIRKSALQFMTRIMTRCPGSAIEEKEYSLVWHYRTASPELGRIRATELILDLNEAFAQSHYKAFPGNKIVEFKSIDIHKGKIVKDLVSQNNFDFILCMGDDITDEDMFNSLASTQAWTIKVGSEFSFSRFNIPASDDAVGLLKTLADET